MKTPEDFETVCDSFTDDNSKEQLIWVDENSEIIGYEFVHLGKMMEMISDGMDANEALAKAKSSYGRFADGVKFVNPRHE